MTRTLNLENIESICKQIAEKEQTLIEVKDYSAYGWTGIHFMTDKFGGCYVALCVSHKNGTITNTFTEGDQQPIETEEELRKLVHREHKKMFKARMRGGISELINAEY